MDEENVDELDEVDEVDDENEKNINSEKISKYTSFVWRCSAVTILVICLLSSILLSVAYVFFGQLPSDNTISSHSILGTKITSALSISWTASILLSFNTTFFIPKFIDLLVSPSKRSVCLCSDCVFVVRKTKLTKIII